MTDQDENKTTVKEELTSKVEASPKTTKVEYGEDMYTIRKLGWRRFVPLFNTFRKFVADILPDEQDAKGMLTGEIPIDVAKLIRLAPIEFIQDIVNDTTDVDPDDEDTTFDLVLLLAGRSIDFNFVDSTGVRDFFSVIGRVVKGGISQTLK